MHKKIEKHEKKVFNMQRSFVVFAVTILIVVAVGNALMINFQLFFQPVLAEQGHPKTEKQTGIGLLNTVMMFIIMIPT